MSPKMKRTQKVKHRWTHSTGWIGICLLLCACSHLPATEKVTSPDQARAIQGVPLPGVRKIPTQTYRILPGDRVEIKFVYHPKFSEQMEVRPDGRISLPIVQEIMAAGKTPGELQKDLYDAFSKELYKPDISVIMRHFEGRVVYVGGAVKTPGVMKVTLPTTLLQAVIYSSGPLTSANEEQVLIIRTGSDQAARVLTVNLEQIRKGNAPDVLLEPYDVIYLPKTTIAKTGEFVETYINALIPRNVSFPFTYELHGDQ